MSEKPKNVSSLDVKNVPQIKGASGSYLSDKDLVSWDTKKTELVIRNFTDLIEQCVLLHGGLSAKNHSRFDMHMFVLASVISIHETERTDAKRGLFIQALIQMLQSGKKTLEDLRNALATQVRQEHTKPETNYQFVLPLNIRHTSSFQPKYIDVASIRYNFR